MLRLSFLMIALSVYGTTPQSVQHVTPKYKIAIIDTGYDTNQRFGAKLKLCDSGHFDFKTGKAELGSSGNHGSAVATIIAEELKGVDYCAVIYQTQGSSNRITADSLSRALEMVSKTDVTAVNLSMEGLDSVKEREALRAVGRRGIPIFVAAGNSSMDLNHECLAFPVCFDVPNLYAVGALNNSMKPATYSNSGDRIKLWYSGQNPVGSQFVDATSFAAPRALSAFILSLDSSRFK